MTQAAQFMQAYARPAAGPDTFAWWQTVQVLLAPSAMKTLKVDPSKVPFTSVTGTPVLAGTASGAKNPATADVLVNVPTNHGTWRVRLTDQVSADSMLVVAATPVKATAHSTSR